ncbi:MAG: OmpA family protein [Planctomycetota bacterium]|nr:OmpA family protein [Planctomycetota bacterium]
MRRIGASSAKMWFVFLALVCAGVAASGCSTAKLDQQIEEQKSLIAQLENEKYQLQTQLTTERAANADLQRRFVAGKSEPATGPGRAVTRGSGAAALEGFGVKGVEIAEVDGYPAVVLSASMLFDAGKATVSKSGQAKLAEIAQVLKSRCPGCTVRVDGHTDNTPIKKSKYATNWALSAARAEAVLKYLIDTARFDKTKVFLAGFGDTKPRESNSTDAGRKANRRVELVIMD